MNSIEDIVPGSVWNYKDMGDPDNQRKVICVDDGVVVYRYITTGELDDWAVEDFLRVFSLVIPDPFEGIELGQVWLHPDRKDFHIKVVGLNHENSRAVYYHEYEYFDIDPAILRDHYTLSEEN